MLGALVISVAAALSEPPLPAEPNDELVAVRLSRGDAPATVAASSGISLTGFVLGFVLMGSAREGRPEDGLGSVSFGLQLAAGAGLVSFGSSFGDLLNDDRERFLWHGVPRALLAAACLVLGFASGGSTEAIAVASLGLTAWTIWAFVDVIDARNAPERWARRNGAANAPVIAPPPSSPTMVRVGFPF
jgi:hypothetical protein